MTVRVGKYKFHLRVAMGSINVGKIRYHTVVNLMFI